MKILVANFSKMINDSGGLAKSVCSFSNAMIQRDHSVTLVYVDGIDGEFFYQIDPQVEIFDLCRMNDRVIKFPKRYKIAREILHPIDIRRARDLNDRFMSKYLLDNVKKVLELSNPDIIVTFQPAASRIFLCDLETQIPVITSSAGDPEDYFHTYPVGELPALEKSAACQVLLPSFINALKSRFPNLIVEDIGNVVPQFEPVDLNLEKSIHKIIFIGRLIRNHKQPHLLIEAFNKIHRDSSAQNWIVELWGSGSDSRFGRELQDMIRKYDLESKVFIKRTTHDVEEVLRLGDIFAMPSRYEGFGLSLAEAMSIGLPAIGFKSCSAVNELIVDSKNGFLCDDGFDDFAEKMLQLIKDRSLRVELGSRAHESMKQYRAEIIWDKWESLIRGVVK